MATVLVVTLGDDHVRTTVTQSETDVDRHIRDFLSNRRNDKKVIGLDVELTLNEERSSTSKSDLPDFTFVGIGIKGSLTKLEKEYGLGCKNAVDLKQFAAEVMRKPQLGLCGVDELALMVGSLKLEKPTSVVFSDWGGEVLNKKQIKLAASNVYAYFKIANKLLNES
ncbi:hypothetical protein SLEP1_g48169 [Rubroshorea leprosula]|uniref:3'-5' exonuclease domain-containing protein n=1 Tax=Rubroshorea leprosula TaxID=152421 RepID=A0AAV5LSS6_9ROSI|nr:hypothetical protein SLEP1_g48169 [Rubroshorea leprosula]